MIKLENIHTDAELLSVFKRLADRLTEKIEESEEDHFYSDHGLATHGTLVEIEEKVLKEFVAQENVLELPPYPIQEEVYPIDHETISLIRELRRK